MASKKRRQPDPTLGELQELLDKQSRAIAGIEETLRLLVRNVCRPMKMNMALDRMRASQVSSEGGPK